MAALLQAGFPEGHRASCEGLLHRAAEALGQRRIDSDLTSRMLLGALQRFCAVVLCLNDGEAVPQHVIEIRQFVLNKPVLARGVFSACAASAAKPSVGY